MFKGLKRNASFLAIVTALNALAPSPVSAQNIFDTAAGKTRAQSIEQSEKLLRDRMEAEAARRRAVDAPAPAPTQIETRKPVDIDVRAPLPTNIEIRPHIPGGSIAAAPSANDLPIVEFKKPTQGQSDLNVIINRIIREADKRLGQAKPGNPLYIIFAEDDHESIPQKLVMDAVTLHFKTMGDKRGFKTVYAYEQSHNEMQDWVQKQADLMNPGYKVPAAFGRQFDTNSSLKLEFKLSISRALAGAFSHANNYSFMYNNGIETRGIDAAKKSDGDFVDFSDPLTRELGLKYFNSRLPANLRMHIPGATLYELDSGATFRSFVMGNRLPHVAAETQASVVIANLGNAHVIDKDNVPGILRARGATVLEVIFDRKGYFTRVQAVEKKKDYITIPDIPDISFKQNTAAETKATQEICATFLSDLKNCFNPNALDKPYQQKIYAQLPAWIGAPAIKIGPRP